MPTSRSRPRAPANGSGTTRARQTRPKQTAGTPGTLTFKGETYRLDKKVGIWPLIQFARSAEAGMQIVDQRGLAAVHAFLQDVIDPDDWGRFQEDMIKKKVDDLTELLETAQQAVNYMMEDQQRKIAAKAKAEVVEEV
jgi:hypothetical protein